ncbi:hypothetical protein N7448_006360 [Penicillium atrosanguineum]|uniref:Structure-specific endonuclease subunit SLX4 n=1 Tax=Penicillium atrosanguineum TaxID=1132637 RepID=A0A9W9PRK3_9EURO|nr:hypothetical protein N7448_006360 [Penicillium atrosanguineum]KAJ5307691.1 hypothetical protein N7476_008347 [Penicillium atrosanguineum]
MTSSADVIVISSSPNPPRTPTRTAIDPDREFAISPQDETPPSLPSPSELLPLPSRSRFFPTPKATDDATKPKRRTTKKTTISDRNDKDASTKSSQRAKKATKEPKPKALGNVETDSLDSRIDASKKATVTAKGRPRKNAKSMGLGNMTLAGKVTKSSSEPQMKKTSEAEKTVQQKSPSGLSEQPGTKESRALNKEEELHLDKAMRRRVNWTPPEEDTPGEVLVVDDDDHLNQNDPHPITTGLGKLLSDYNYSGSGSEIRKLPANAIRGGLTKRRRIELVDPQIYHQTNKIASNEESSVQEGDSSSSSAKTKKKPKIQKRFTTLTARMTAQYATKEPEDDLMGDIVPDVGKPKSRRGKAKSTDKGHIFTVLSPEAAAKSLETQDLMFGTCSQLEREDSPQTLREMQQAIRESEGFFSVEKEAGAVSGVVSRGAGERGLWSVGARDTEGSLIQAEPLDMVDLTSPFEAPQKKEFAIATIKAHAPAARGDDDWLDLDIEQPDTSPKKTTLQPEKRSTPVAKPKLATHAEPVVAPRGISAKVASHQRAESQQPSMPHYSGFTDAELSSQVASFGFKSVRGRKKMIELLQKCWESKHGSSVPVTLSQLPQVADSTQTATQTTINKPKAKAKSKQSTTMSTSKATTKKAELAAVSTPKKSIQKASKAGQNTQPSFIDVEEIQDSEDDIFLSPSQVQKRYTEIFSKTASSNREPSLDITTKSSQPQSPTKRRTTTAKSARTAKQVTTSISKADKVDSSKRSSLADLSMQITKAVRLQSQSSRPSTHASRLRPTWQEKIVMYDPIILEDLTAWLNVEGLALVGEDREVHTGVVRGWCESKGICCCWKKNARW